MDWGLHGTGFNHLGTLVEFDSKRGDNLKDIMLAAGQFTAQIIKHGR